MPIASGVEDKRTAFRRLHESGCFVIPNPWDVGSALQLQALGFKALASTSSGFAWSRGRRDNALPLNAVLAHLRELVEAVALPVNADFENGFAADPAGVGENVRRAVDTGVAGLSIEDSTGAEADPLFPVDEAVARVRAARAAIDATGGGTLLVARAEGLLAGRPDLADTIDRLRAYADAGADCLYAPGLRTLEDVAAVVRAVHPKPVNVLVGAAGGMTLQELDSVGVRRVSVGGALARAAWGGFLTAARRLAEGRFDALPATPSHGDIDRLMPP